MEGDPLDHRVPGKEESLSKLLSRATFPLPFFRHVFLFLHIFANTYT